LVVLDTLPSIEQKTENYRVLSLRAKTIVRALDQIKGELDT